MKYRIIKSWSGFQVQRSVFLSWEWEDVGLAWYKTLEEARSAISDIQKRKAIEVVWP